ncbi:BREX-1 system adenine-specific DNA-methyltransferase PglX [Mycobacteroides abscessus]
METAPLKAFATSARTELIREVTARITAVLGQGSPERVESPAKVTALEKAVAAGGGGNEGKAHVADKVAYTWFNRIIALRFMDANGYTGIGVVSPAADQVGQPEVLAAAKRGQIDKEVVSSDHSMAAIAGLLNGTRQPRLGADAQAEAYSLLFAAYCQFWHKAMPFMFERQGDFTELLIPANLLAGDSVLNRSVEVLTEDACKDVEVIGWLYQFYISERKDEVFAGFKKNKKAGVDEIRAATQLFTPHWIVRYLVENSLGRLWMLNRPTSRLVHRMDYYIVPADEETEFLKIARPEELKVIDPACGSGHMLTYAFDLLYAIYEEEGYAPSEIPGLILANNLFGTEIDPRAGALAAFALTMKAAAKRKLFLRTPVDPNICVIEPISFSPDVVQVLVTKDGDRDAEEAFWNQFAEADTQGSLIRSDPQLTALLGTHLEGLSDEGDLFKSDAIERARRVVVQAEFLNPHYAVAVANPPYMGSKNMDAALLSFAKQAYKDAKADLMTMFMRRAQELVVANGYWAMINMPSWMFLNSFTIFREWLLTNCQIRSLLHLGRGVFGSDFGSVAFICKRSAIGVGQRGIYRRLFERHVDVRANEKIRDLFLDFTYQRFDIEQAAFTALPGKPIAYWFPASLLSLFQSSRSLESEGRAAIGMITGDNAIYLRRWFEVSRTNIGTGMSRAEAAESGLKWFPYAKGGDFRRWAGNYDFVVNWHNDGADLQTRRTPDGSRVWAHNFNLDRIFAPGITWTVVTAGRPSFRIADKGFLFADAAGVWQSTRILYHLALLNSAATDFVLEGLNPTVNLHPSYLGAIPVPEDPNAAVMEAEAKAAVEVSKDLWDRDERSWDFTAPPWSTGNVRVEHEIRNGIAQWHDWDHELLTIQRKIDAHFGELFGIAYAAGTGNGESICGENLPNVEAEAGRLASYAVGCMFGRYSLDKPGLILADQGATLQDYLAKVSNPTFMPDDDNVIPIVDGDWFEDDIVGRFRKLLRVAFGDKHFEDNLNFVTEALGVKNLREYFITKTGKSKFYDDHVQRYKKRPIYWLFSSPKGSFNALIYLHRYTPSTASTVLTYLREYVTKLESSLQQAERAGNAKEADRLRKILVELNEYEHDTLYPKASENVVIDLDDGVKVNYPKLGGALRKIAGLESSGD